MQLLRTVLMRTGVVSFLSGTVLVAIGVVTIFPLVLSFASFAILMVTELLYLTFHRTA